MTTGVLYTFRRCPYAIRARLALAATVDAPIPSLLVREVLLRDKPQAMLALSPKGTVPVLALDDGRVIDESLEIMVWALARSEPNSNHLQALQGHEAQALIAENDGPFKAALDRYKYTNRYTGADTIEALREASYERCREFLDRLEARLGEPATQWHLLGAEPGPLDWAVFPFVRQFAAVEPARFDRDFPAVSAWKARQQATPLFRRVMSKLAPWRPGDAPLPFDAAYPPLS